jgi:hypothetical protein
MVNKFIYKLNLLRGKNKFAKLFCLEVKMKIKVERENHGDEGLVFTIRVSDPHTVPFDEHEKQILHKLDICQKEIENMLECKERDEILRNLFTVRDKIFKRVLNNMTFAIEANLKPKFQHMCQEIYNWLYDKQAGDPKKWMEEFDPQRSIYYFDNDRKAEDYSITEEDEDEDDDEDSDED